MWKRWLEDPRLLDRLIWGLVILVALSLVGFGGFYYWDRYVGRLGDKSPAELAAEHLEEQVRKNPNDPELRVAVAQAYFQLGRLEDAAEQAEQALKLDPQHRGALFLLGVTYTRLGENEKALEVLDRFEEASQGVPVDAMLEAGRYYAGLVRYRMGRYEEAIEKFQAALKINPGDADALYNLGLTYQVLNRHEEAVQAFLNATRYVPDFLEAYQGLEESYRALGDEVRARWARGMILYSSKEYDAAVEILQEVADAVEGPEGYLGLALALERKGDLEAALAAVEKALERDPENLAARQAQGRIQHLLQVRATPPTPQP